ncbi:helix-turn-helix domain-containing protein [Vibrio cholerae]|nr:helix-turn-helix domain-containing protein [Vibrio cholerae]EJL6563173.1 helix-turn-helix domain-containing protein [Vibrio cholerae]
MLHTSNPIIKHKAGLLNLAEELGNVSRACKVMGVSRDTFYRYQELVETGGIHALINRSRRAPNLKNRVDSETEQAVIKYAIDFPAHGQVRTSNELRKLGVFISPSGVRSIWLRNDLENFKKRLIALEKQAAENGIILTDEQVAALERKKHDDEACGEIETAHPGYLGSQDTFYVGNLKGIGRIYQQTFVDTYSKVAFAKLYTTKTPITAADILNEFYQVTFRKKLYGSIEELQKDLDEWTDYYNNHRTHQGKMCCGRTPIETLEDGKSIWAEKNLAQI